MKVISTLKRSDPQKIYELLDELTERLWLAQSYYNDDCTPVDPKVYDFSNKICNILVEYKVAYKKDIKEKDSGYKIKRYCFNCKNVQTFVFCDNCSSYGCTDCSNYLEDKYEVYGGIRYSYWVHRCCW